MRSDRSDRLAIVTGDSAELVIPESWREWRLPRVIDPRTCVGPTGERSVLRSNGLGPHDSGLPRDDEAIGIRVAETTGEVALASDDMMEGMDGSSRANEDPPLPDRLPLLPLRGDVVFPHTVVPLIVGRPSGIKLIEDLIEQDHQVLGLITQRDPDEDDPDVDGLYVHLCVANLLFVTNRLKMLKFPDGTARIATRGIARARLVEAERKDSYLIGRVELLPEVMEPGVHLDARRHNIDSLFRKMVEQSQEVPEQLQVAALNTDGPGRLADLLGSSLPFTVEEKQDLLRESDVAARLELLGTLLAKHLHMLEISSKIQEQVGSEIGKAQRDHFLRQQLKAIQEELGEGSDGSETRDLRQRLEEAKLPAEAKAEADRELERLGGIHPSSAEYSIVRTYLDWLTVLPWRKSSRDRLDLREAREVLESDHYKLDKVKERILEYLAVRKLTKDMKGPILCFVGPPGTGKTSLGQSIARAMGRRFVRISLGGIHDEAEIRGHRRTYVAAMPGRIIQGLRKSSTNNPVFMLDEIDKLGHDFRGDPASALLEVLDPEQNTAFRDHYLDVDFDLSRVLFIATANQLGTIPAPLRDRMEVLELPGYSEEEKREIAHRYLIPKQVAQHGLKDDQLRFQDEAISQIIADYTRESGLRNLERELAAICRKAARRRAEGARDPLVVDPSLVGDWLGPPRHFREVALRNRTPGLATGLAWTPTGGEILLIEAVKMPGKGELTLTGLLGDSMRESVRAALTYLRSHGFELGLTPPQIPVHKADLHIHVPAGAVPKDGPSAGLAITAALISLFRDRSVRHDLAMTGEVTLTGRVLPVGGIREKLLAARRAGIATVLLPKLNQKDLTDLPSEVRDDLTVHLVESLDEISEHLFVEEQSAPPKSRGTSVAAKAKAQTRSKAKTSPATRPKSPARPTRVKTTPPKRPKSASPPPSSDSLP